MSEQVMISRELLADLCDMASDSVESHRQAFAGYKIERQAAMDATVKQAYTILKEPAQPVTAQPAGEVPEVVATVESYGGKWAGIHWGNTLGETSDPERQLMTIAQHLRIVAAQQAREVVLPSVDQVMRIVLDFQDNKRNNVTGTTNWAANLGMAVIDEVARLNGIEAKP